MKEYRFGGSTQWRMDELKENHYRWVIDDGVSSSCGLRFYEATGPESSIQSALVSVSIYTIAFHIKEDFKRLIDTTIPDWYEGWDWVDKQVNTLKTYSDDPDNRRIDTDAVDVGNNSKRKIASAEFENITIEMSFAAYGPRKDEKKKVELRVTANPENVQDTPTLDCRS